MTSNIINTIPGGLENRAELQFASGDVVKVVSKIKEANGKTRLQNFEGLVLARKHGTTAGATFTVRKVASGVGVERIFPLYSMSIDKIEIVRHNKTRKSKLYYVREKAVKDVRRKLKSTGIKKVNKSGITTAEIVEEEMIENNVA